MPHHHYISFCKMHGLGNDFVILNAFKTPIEINEITIPTFSNRHIGVGFDQLLIIEPSKQADFFCRIFNADGSEAEQCGNGLRCVARFIIEENLHHANQFTIETKAGIFPVFIEDFEHITVHLKPAVVDNTIQHIELTHPKQCIALTALSLGNPHAILRVDHVDTAPVDAWGLQIAAHSKFPTGANVGFMEIVDASHIRLRTYERGIGETHACGSNACAAVSAGILNQWLNKKVSVEFRYGTLTIEQLANGTIQMMGPATRVFDGVIMF